MILAHLLGGTKRFMQLSRLVPGATPRMLSLQLRELEHDGIIVRTVFPEVPPRVEYSMTEKGVTLRPILCALRDWALKA